jgi:hypothetical protein
MPVGEGLAPPVLSIIDTQRLSLRRACFASLNAKFASKLVAAQTPER